MFGGNFGARKLHTVNRRMFIIGTAKIIVFTGIIARLFSLQISDNKKYLTLSDKNRLREWRLPPIRGEFVDYFGNTIAGNLKVYQLHVIPEEVENFRYLMLRLKEILALDVLLYISSNLYVCHVTHLIVGNLNFFEKKLCYYLF